MTVSDRIILREDVRGPATRAAEGVEKLSEKLGELGNVKVDAKAAAKIERLAKSVDKAKEQAAEATRKASKLRESASKAEEEAQHAAENVAGARKKAEDKAGEATKKAMVLRESASKAEKEALEAAQHAAYLKASGLDAEKASLKAEQLGARAKRQSLAAERAETTAKKLNAGLDQAQINAERQALKLSNKASKQKDAADRAESVARKRGKAAESALKASEDAKGKIVEQSVKRAAKAKKEAEREEARKNKPSKMLKELEDQIKNFDPHHEKRAATLEAQLARMKKQARSGVDTGEELGVLALLQKEWMPKLSKMGSKAGRNIALAAAAVAIAAASVKLTSAAGHAAYDFGVAAVRAQAFREDSVRALQTIRRTKGDAGRIYDMAVHTADFIGQDRQETLGQFVTLLNQFGDEKMVDRIIRSVADLKTAAPNVNSDAIVRAMGKIKATGYLQGDELNMLTEAGVAAEKVYENLAKRLGKTTDEIKTMQGARKLSADDTNESILAVMNETASRKPPGQAAHEKSLEDISGLVDRLHAMPGNMLGELEVTPGMKAYKDFMRGTVETLDPAGDHWKRAKAVLSDVSGSIFASIFRSRDPADIIEGVISKIETAGPIISHLFSGFSTGFHVVTTIFDRMDKGFGSLKKALGMPDIHWIEMVARGIGVIAGGIGLVVGLVGVLGGAVVSLAGDIVGVGLAAVGGYEAAIEYLYDLLGGTDFDADGIAIGTALVDGVVSGVKSGALAVATAVKALAAGTIGAGETAFGIASPSKPFTEIGAYVAKGAEVGITGGAGRVIQSAERMALMATEAANDRLTLEKLGVVLGGARAGGKSGGTAKVAQDEQGAARGRGGTVINIGTINITVQGGGTEKDGEAIARVLWDELRRIAEEEG